MDRPKTVGIGRGQALKDDFDPMRDAYNDPNFNSYTNVPGAAMKSSHHTELRRREDRDNIKLYVSSIPANMNEIGIKNIFLSVGDPINIYLGAKAGAKYKWGFVEFRTINEAQRALHTINKAPPHYLNVSYAIGEESKAESVNDNSEKEFRSEMDLPPPTFGRGRGSLPRIQGVPPRMNKQLNKYEAIFDSDVISLSHSQDEFNHYDCDPSTEAINEVYASMTCKYSTNGMWRVSMGRGACVIDPVTLMPVVNYPKRGPEIKDKILRFLSFQYTAKSNGVYSYNNKTLKIGGVCEFCDRPAELTCPYCKVWYCSKICVTEFREKHLAICEPRSIHFRPDGTSFTTRDDCPWLEEPMNGSIDLAPWELNASKEARVLNGHSDPSQVRKFNKKPSEQEEESKDDIHHKERVTGRTARGPPGSSRLGSRSSGASSKGEQQPYVRNQKPKFDSNWEPPKAEQKDTPSAPASSPVTSIQGKTPIPTNCYTKVQIAVCDSSPGVYWVIPSNSISECQKISESIHKFIVSGKAEPLKPVPKSKCAAPYDGDNWYRAKVLTTEPCIKVLFVDFGNEHVVNPDQVKMLPPELYTRAPLAFKIKVASNSSVSKLKLLESAEINIKILYKEGPDMWVVHIEGEPDPEIPKEVSNDLNKNDVSPLKPGVFQSVVVSYCDGGFDYWVQLSSLTKTFVELSSNLTKLTPTTAPPKLHEIYVKDFAGIWCRAKVINTNPLEVFYIDYGNSERTNPSALHILPIDYKNVPPFAFRIRLGPNTPTKFKGLDFMASLYVKPLSKSQDGVITCTAAELPDEENGVPASQPVEKIQHVLLMVTDKTKIEIKVTKVLSLDQLTGTMILNGVSHPSYTSVEKMSELIASTSKSSTTSYKPGDQVAMKVEGCWLRGYTMRTSTVDQKVKRAALVDVGKVAFSTEVVPLPKEVDHFADAGVRLLFGDNAISYNLEGTTLTVESLEKVNSKVILTVSGLGQAEVIPWEPLFEEGGLPVVSFPSGSKAILTSIHSPQALYVQSTAQENILTLERLSQDIASHCYKVPAMTNPPVLGQLLCCKFDVDQTYYRAQVYKIIDNKFKVTFVDYGNQEIVPITNFKPLTQDLKEVPCMALKIGLSDVPGKTFTPTAITYLNTLTDSITEVFVSYEGSDLSNAKVTLQNGTSVNSTVAKMQEESWKTNSGGQSLPVVLMAKDIKYCPWKKGSDVSLAVLGKIKEHVFLALDRKSPLVDHSLDELTPKMTQYCESFPADEAYNPRLSELCLAKFSEDNQWYRAVCLKSLRTTSCVLFFDYGNSGEVNHKDIRKMPPDFMANPALLKKCSVYGISNSGLSPDALTALSKFFDIGSVHDAKVIEDDWQEGCCLVWVPGLSSMSIPGLPPIKCPDLVN